MKAYRFNILLVTLLLLLLIYPFLDHFQLVGLTYLLNVFSSPMPGQMAPVRLDI